MSNMTSDLDETLKALERKLKMVKFEYDKYFLGSRPNEPVMLRGEVQKAVMVLSQNPIRNTAERFRFNSINSRFQAFKRQWDATLRQIEAGTYKRHRFKADLRDRERGVATTAAPTLAPETPSAESEGDRMSRIFEAYRDAAVGCGQDTSKLTQAKLEKVIAKQEAAIRKKLDCQQVDFRVVVQDGKVKLKASASRS